jgi:hypothetical protein
MSQSAALAALRKRHFALDALPDTIVIPAFEARQRATNVRAIADATVDDIAFVLLAAEVEFNSVGDRLHALRKLYSLARQAGALGADRVVDAVSHTGGH